MGYSVLFYALDGCKLSERLRDSSDELLKEIESNLDTSDATTPQILDAARLICQNRLPESCGVEYFEAIAWLAQVTSERVSVCSFNDFRVLSYLDEIAIWPWLTQYPPPFPIPRNDDDYPAAGYLPVARIEAFAMPAFAHLPQAADRYVVNARDDFRDVLETLVRDQLDLLAVLL